MISFLGLFLMLMGLPAIVSLLEAHAEGESASSGPLIWPSKPPADCPFEGSSDIVGVAFTGRHKEYTKADTWLPSWGSDGNLYSPWTDGIVNDVVCYSFNVPEQPQRNIRAKPASTGHATIVGDDPMQLQVINAGTFDGDPSPWPGRYPCGTLVHNGVWYYGTYCVKTTPGRPDLLGDIVGPLVGFRYSTNCGETWTDTAHTPTDPLFEEAAKLKIAMGHAHFVDFGKNMEHSPDGKAYLVCPGAAEPDPKPREANLSWITGDQIYMMRVEPSPENINDAGKYEFFAGHDENGKPLWASDFAEIKPLVDWNNGCGCVTMTYNAPLKKHLMVITDGWPTTKTYNTYILESDQVTGPWKLVTYMEKFGDQAYFVNIPSKFVSDDGRTAWLMYSANWRGPGRRSDPVGGKYAMCLQEIKLLDEKMVSEYETKP